MSVALHLGGDRAIAWPDTRDARVARAYFEPILREGTTFVAPNVDADLGIAIVDAEVVPYTVSRELGDQSYVVSPYTHYITYGAEEIGKLETPALEAPLRVLVRGLGALFRAARFDRVVYVDNWLTSTTLHPPLRASGWRALIDALVCAHPDHAIVVRGVDRRVSAALREALADHGARFVFSRRVLFQDPSETRRRSDAKKDRALLDRALADQSYRIVDVRALDDAQLTRVTELYELLYVVKWSRHNPRLTARYATHAIRCGFLEGRALVAREGSIDGVFAAWVRHGVYYVPLLGYDTRLPRERGLYRMLAALSSDDALARGALVHDSAGVSDFKQNRGAVPALEHLAVFDAHLPPHRRAPWRALGTLMDRIGAPLIERFDL
ncbi:MAG: GNAT family N-acetyltransferase [Sandaracinaceae bacterium]